MALTHEQKRVAFHLYSVGRKKHQNRRQILAALETALGEANLTNPRGGTGTSAGWRQEISNYGSVGKRRNIRGGAARFYNEIAGKHGPSYALAFAAQRPAQAGGYYKRFKPQAQDVLRWLERTYGKGKGYSRGRGGRGATIPGALQGKLVTTPGVSHAPERQQAKLALLQQSGAKMPSQNQLLGLASQLRQLQDEPAQQSYKIKRGKPQHVGGGGGGGRVVHGGGYPLARHGKIIGTPYTGTHTLGNWQSDRAIDIAVPVGTPVLATGDGVVVKVSPGGLGRFAGIGITIRGKKGDEYFFKHLSKSRVRAGQRVRKGQVIGRSGSANGVAHLHFARRRGSIPGPYR